MNNKKFIASIILIVIIFTIFMMVKSGGYFGETEIVNFNIKNVNEVEIQVYVYNEQSNSYDHELYLISDTDAKEIINYIESLEFEETKECSSKKIIRWNEDYAVTIFMENSNIIFSYNHCTKYYNSVTNTLTEYKAEFNSKEVELILKRIINSQSKEIN